MWGPCLEKMRGLPTGSWVRVAVYTSFSRLQTWETCVNSNAYFRLVCSEMFSLFLLIDNFDLIKFLAHTCGAPKVLGPCSGEHVRTFLNPALFVVVVYSAVLMYLSVYVSAYDLASSHFANSQTYHKRHKQKHYTHIKNVKQESTKLDRTGGTAYIAYLMRIKLLAMRDVLN